MGILAAISSAIDGLGRSTGPPIYPSQSTYVSGPAYLDAFQAKRAPSGWELIEQYKSIIYACVQLNALGVSRVPLRLMSDATKGAGPPREVAQPRAVSRSYVGHLWRSGYLARTTARPDDVQEITVHPLLKCLDQPDPEGAFDRRSLLTLVASYLDVVGVAYLKLDVAGRQPPTALWPMQAQHVQDIKTAPDPRVAYYLYFGQPYQPEDLLRFRPPALSLRDPYGRGYPPTYAALQYAMLEDKYVAIQDQLLGQGPRPNLLISAKDATMPIGDAEKRRYEQDLTRLHARGGAGGALVTNGAVDVKPLTYAPTDLGGMQLSEYDLERTCNVFGVPAAYFTRETNLANLQAAEAQHARTAIEPRCHAIAGTLTRLAQRYDERLFFAFDPAVEEDKEREARIVDMGLKTGRITINEANAESPWEPKDWGDEPWLPGTLKQPTMLQDVHEQGLEAQKQTIQNQTKATEFQFSEGGDEAGGGSGEPDDGGDPGDAGRSADRGGAAVDAGPGVGDRLDAILAGVERDLGL